MLIIDILILNVIILYILSLVRVFWWSYAGNSHPPYPVVIRQNWGSRLLLSLVDATIPSKQWRLINTGIKIEAPLFRDSLNIRLVTERSERFGWDLINYGYTIENELYVIVFNNHPRYPTRIHPGDPFLTISFGGVLLAGFLHGKEKTVTDNDIVETISKER
ncbi:MAG: hypothetical protein WC979_09220 [Candidatus Pacearchaeota archaeon]|jgi:hypothetical protein